MITHQNKRKKINIIEQACGTYTIENGTCIKWEAPKEITEPLHVHVPEGITVIAAHAFTPTTQPAPRINRLTCPSTLTHIQHQAFQHARLDSIELNQGLRKIGDHAFEHVTCIKHIHIPNSVQVIGKGAFQNSTLMYCQFEAMSNCIRLREYAFAHSQLKRISIPRSIQSIDRCVFYKTPLQHIVFQEGSQCQKIGAYALAHTHAQHALTLPNSIEFMGTGICEHAQFVHVKLPNNPACTRIPYRAFYKSNVRRITCPKNIIRVEKEAFAESAMIQTQN